MRDAANIIITANGGELPKTASGMGKTATQDVPIAPELAKPRKDLIIPVNGVYFDQMLRGEKVEEFRVRTEYWRKRLVGRSYRNLVLTRGYPKGGGVDFVTRLTVPYCGYRETEITHEHFGSDPVKVFAIRVHLEPTR